MTEKQVKDGKYILEQLTQARNIKKQLENEQNHLKIGLKDCHQYDVIADFKNNAITQKFFPEVTNYLRCNLRSLIDSEIKHFEEELERI